jgi:hypothetical protein
MPGFNMRIERGTFSSLSSNTNECFSFITAVVFFVFHVADLATDIIACVNYNNIGLDSYYKATLAFLIIPFIYVVIYCHFETGGLDGLTMCGSFGYSFLNYFLGPLMPILFSKTLTKDALTKLQGFGMFGTAYMEDIPQVIIGLFFLLKVQRKLNATDRLIAILQVITSAVSGLYKLFAGAAKLGGGKVNICNQDVDCPC